jgi:hypothetical protein
MVDEPLAREVNANSNLIITFVGERQGLEEVHTNMVRVGEAFSARE